MIHLAGSLFLGILAFIFLGIVGIVVILLIVGTSSYLVEENKKSLQRNKNAREFGKTWKSNGMTRKESIQKYKDIKSGKIDY